MLSDKVVEKIKNEHITPKPRWQFTARVAVLWVLFAASIITGGAAVSVVVYMAGEGEWQAVIGAKDRAELFALAFAPLIWAMVFFALVAFAWRNFSSTRQGYKYGFWFITLFSLFASTAIGAGFTAYHFGEKFDAGMAQAMPVYKPFAVRKLGFWSRPGTGRLAGEIKDLEDAERLMLEDFFGRSWIVERQDAVVRPCAKIEKGEVVKIFGEERGATLFFAREILPWKCMEHPMPPQMKEMMRAHFRP